MSLLTVHSPGSSGQHSSNVAAYASFTAVAPIYSERRVSNTGWKKQRMRTLVRDNFSCQVEGCKVNRLSLLTVHHITPRCKGGLDNLSNLLTVCREHHGQLHSGETIQLKNGEVCTCSH